MQSRLRDLSKQIKALCESHMAYSQVVDIIQVMCDSIDARAYIEEVNAREVERQVQSAHDEKKGKRFTAAFRDRHAGCV